MAVNSRFMLPLKVLKMEQSGELLDAEHTELELLRERISHEKKQLYLHSCDDALPRLERVYGFPVNSDDPLEARRRRLLAKHNARGVCTPKTLRETVFIITGNPSDIIEHFSEGYFSVIVHMPLEEATDYLREVISQISEQRPAHLLFETIADFGAIPISNRLAPNLHSLDFHARADNLGADIPRFNGWHQFGRALRFGGSITKGLKIHSLQIGLRNENRWSCKSETGFQLQGWMKNTHSAHMGLGTSTQNTETAHVPIFTVQAVCRNRNHHPATLTKDSRWAFGQEHKFNGIRRFNGAGYTKEEL